MSQFDPIRWGVLGTGRMASSFASALAELDDAVLRAVGSRTEASAQMFATQFGVPNRYGSYSDLIHDPDIQVVYIATPHASHAQLSIACLEAGKAVLCEKAFTLNADQAESVVQTARREDQFLMEAMWTRFVPAVEKLTELLSREKIGEPQLMVAGGAYMPEFDPASYIFNKEIGGGILLDAGVYMVSMASMIFGAPEKIMAIGELGRTGVDEHEAIILSHSRGEIANLYVSHRARSAPDLTLLGSKGKIYLHPPIFCPSGLTLCVHGEAEEIFDFSDDTSGYRHEAIEVGRCLRAGLTESTRMPLDETLAVMRTMDEIRRQIGLRYSVDQD